MLVRTLSFVSVLFVLSFCLFYMSSHAVQMMDVSCCECHFFNHWDIKTCALYGNKMKTWICLTFSLSCFSLSLFTQTSRVPVGATVAHHNLNDLIMIHGIPLQQRNMGTLDRIAQYEHCRRNEHILYKLQIVYLSLYFSVLMLQKLVQTKGQLI